MRAMLLDTPRRLLRAADIPRPEPGPGQVLLAVAACGVCRTDLHVLDGELPNPKAPLILGHEIVGTVTATGGGPGVDRFGIGDRVGVPWLGWSCGECRYCRSGRENLCDRARFTGYQIDGGYAEYAVADARFCFPLPDHYADLEAAPLLCAGLIGYRSLVAAGEAERLGLYGFCAAAHIVAQVARHQGRRVFAFTRAGDRDAQRFALGLGAEWAGTSDAPPPEPLDAAIIFAPAGPLVPARARERGAGPVARRTDEGRRGVARRRRVASISLICAAPPPASAATSSSRRPRNCVANTSSGTRTPATSLRGTASAGCSSSCTGRRSGPCWTSAPTRGSGPRWRRRRCRARRCTPWRSCRPPARSCAPPPREKRGSAASTWAWRTTPGGSRSNTIPPRAPTPPSRTTRAPGPARRLTAPWSRATSF